MKRRISVLILNGAFALALAAMLRCPCAPFAASAADEPPGSFDGERAFRDLRALAEIGPRPSGSDGSLRAAKYILGELQVDGLKVREEDFSAQTPLGLKKMKNITAFVPGRSDEVIVIGAHYDTKHIEGIQFVGANDGAAGPAALLELARCLPRRDLEPEIWLVFFDGEEAFVKWSEADGLYGSRHFVRRLRESNELQRVRAMILLDMIGDADLSIEMEMNSTRRLRDIVWEQAARLGYRKYFTDRPAFIEDDHIPFLRAGVAALDIIDYHYGPDSRSNEFWHTAEDTLDKVSPASLQVVGDVVIASLSDVGLIGPQK